MESKLYEPPSRLSLSKEHYTPLKGFLRFFNFELNELITAIEFSLFVAVGEVEIYELGLLNCNTDSTFAFLTVLSVSTGFPPKADPPP